MLVLLWLWAAASVRRSRVPESRSASVQSITSQVMESRRAPRYPFIMSVTNNGFGPLLREWRQRRRISQLDLSLDGNISTRHLSFLKPGRARPSRDMVLHLAEQ